MDQNTRENRMSCSKHLLWKKISQEEPPLDKRLLVAFENGHIQIAIYLEIPNKICSESLYVFVEDTIMPPQKCFLGDPSFWILLEDLTHYDVKEYK